MKHIMWERKAQLRKSQQRRLFLDEDRPKMFSLEEGSWALSKYKGYEFGGKLFGANISLFLETKQHIVYAFVVVFLRYSSIIKTCNKVLDHLGYWTKGVLMCTK